MIAPVSVCHHVSTIGQRSPPIVWWYHIHASGLIGSPTEPSRRRRDRSCFAGHSVAPVHERADGGRRGVEDRDAVALDDLPEAILLRPVGRALVHHARSRRWRAGRRRRSCGRSPSRCRPCTSRRRRPSGRRPTWWWRRRRRDSRRWCGRCPSASPSCRTCRGCRACPRRPSARARTRRRRVLHQPVPPVVAALLHVHRRPARRLPRWTTTTCSIDGVSFERLVGHLLERHDLRRGGSRRRR